MRVDARRNIESILGAAVELLARRPEASMSQVAQAAGVTRQTVYAHFPNREALFAAVVDQAMEQAVAAIDDARLEEGPADEALRRLVVAAWRTIEQYHRIVEAAESVLGHERFEGHHQPVLERVEQLVRRGRREGAFDAGVPVRWLLATWIALQHAAAREVADGRMTAAAAEKALLNSLSRAFAA